jgi:hypothetical protein
MKNKTIPIRVSEAEEAEIKRRAEIIGISKSSFLREGVLHDNITVLDKGQDIVSEFVLLRKEISNAIRLQKTDALSEEKIMAKLDEISALFSEVLEQTTVFNQNEEEDGYVNT